MTELPYDTIPVPNDWDRGGLPAWTYHSPALFDLERDKLFLTHWQVVGHVGDIPAAGDWLAFDMLGERAVVMRGNDGVVRAFHNLCRHRGARVVDGEKGHCKGAIVCPFHGWVYNLDGTLRGAARPSSFGELKREDFGLKPIEMEIFHGFIFLRFKDGPQPSVAELLAPYAADFAAYGLDKLLPVRNLDWTAELPVNWKSVRDVDNEGYHVALAHPEPAGTLRPHLSRPAPEGRAVGVDRLVRRRPGAQLVGEELRAHLAAAARTSGPSAEGLDLLRPVSQRGLRRHAGGRAVLPGNSDWRRAAPGSPAGMYRWPDESRQTTACPLPRLPHRPLHLGRGPAALDLVERVDEIGGLRGLPPLRPRIRVAPPP